MLISEIASAEDQIALFKLITDKVWQALGDQQRAEAEAKAANPLKSKLVPPSAKGPNPTTARQTPKPAVRPAPLANPTKQSIPSSTLEKQPKYDQSQSTKQKASLSNSNGSQSIDSDDSRSERVRPHRGHDRHS